MCAILFMAPLVFPSSELPEPALEEVVRLHTQLLDSTHEAKIVRELGTGVILSWNRGAETLYGWTLSRGGGAECTPAAPDAIPSSPRGDGAGAGPNGRLGGQVTAHGTRRERAFGGQPVGRAARSRPPTGDAPGDEPRRHRGRRAWEEQQRLLGQAASAEALFHGVLESAADPIVLTDENGYIVAANRQTEMLLGYTRKELIGASVEILVPAALRAKHVGERAGYCASPRTRLMGEGLELCAQHKNGTSEPLSQQQPHRLPAEPLPCQRSSTARARGWESGILA